MLTGDGSGQRVYRCSNSPHKSFSVDRIYIKIKSYQKGGNGNLTKKKRGGIFFFLTTLKTSGNLEMQLRLLAEN